MENTVKPLDAAALRSTHAERVDERAEGREVQNALYVVRHIAHGVDAVKRRA